MTIKGLRLPEMFVADAQEKKFRRARGSWDLLRESDAWGKHLETELAEVYEDEGRILAASEELAKHFPPEFADEPDISEDEPGFIPYIADFSRVVCFGASGDDAPFCFDFRKDVDSPEVIWWADAYWRRIAPDWLSFVALFDL